MKRTPPIATQLTASSLEQAWLLRGADVYQEAARMVTMALTSGESEKTAVGRALRERAEQLSGLLLRQAEADWRSFLKTAAPNQMPLPVGVVQIDLDLETQIPGAKISEDYLAAAAAAEASGVVDIPVEGEADFSLLTAFRPLRLQSLPAGTVHIAIRDTRHVALALVSEMVSIVDRDIASAVRGVAAEMGWKRINRLAVVYLGAAQLARQEASDDEYVQWTPRMPEVIDLGSAAKVICDVAASARLMRAMAVHLVGAWLRHTLDLRDSLPALERLQALRADVTNAQDQIATQLHVMHRQRFAEAGIDESQFEPMMVFRPVPESAPLLAAIPVSNKPPVRGLVRSATT